MKEATVRRMHTPVYSETQYPPLPSRIRLAANCWERVWWLTLVEPLENPERLKSLCQRFTTDTVTVRAQMRTHRKVCFAITTQELEEQSEFEIAMVMMAHVDKDIGSLERIEGRPSAMWPIEEFKR